MTVIGGARMETVLSQLRPWSQPAPAISKDEYAARLARAQELMEADGVDVLMVGAGASLRYFSGVGWEQSERLVVLLLPKSGDPLFVCPKFEEGTLEQSKAIDAPVRCWQEHESPYALACGALKELSADKIAADPAMAFTMTERMRNAAPSAQLIDASRIIDRCRSIKSPAEIALLQQAKSMTLEVHKRAAQILHPGIDTNDVARFIDAAHRALGASGSSFCIVLFGKATSFPHGVPYPQELREDDVVLIDTGCAVQGYHSDITRTYVFGKASDAIRTIWALEKEAQHAAFAAAQPGVACEHVDHAARAVLERAGLGPDYELPGLPHRTGHGVGLSIHEAPYLVRGDKTPLSAGMCFSNEPTIVVPNKFGVRLEDHFHMTDNGAQWFTYPSHSIDAPFG